MDDALLVRRLERLGNLPRDRKRLVQRNWPACDAIREGRAVDQLLTSARMGRLKPAPTSRCT